MLKLVFDNIVLILAFFRMNSGGDGNAFLAIYRIYFVNVPKLK